MVHAVLSLMQEVHAQVVVMPTARATSVYRGHAHNQVIPVAKPESEERPDAVLSSV